jgi:hypothetical protein
MGEREGGKGLHAKGAEGAEVKGRPPIEEDGGRCIDGCGPQRGKDGEGSHGESPRRLNYGERGGEKRW